ncbi:MAG: hypothetical protein HY291_18580 [Planctomycetes bacterium]|nr:hypothetical protein [Planctomycetota bacterium]
MMRRMGTAAVLLGLVLFVSGATRTAAEDAQEDVKMVAIGGLSASFLVQTYFNIGLVADASAKKDADKEQLQAVLASVENLLAETEKQLDAVMKSEIKDEDKAALKKIKSCYALLDEEITALKGFWKDSSEANGKTFQTARVEAWNKITATLGIK